ncbi:MAG: 50S ribosomal protein L22 [Candidatus Diapherotrites archaeon]
MVKKNYQIEIPNEKKIAKAVAKNAHASLKYSTELVRELKGQRLDRSMEFLQRIMEKKEHLPLRRYKKKVPHRKGETKSFTKTGRYPVKTAGIFSSLLESVKSNADYKGLDAENLLITHMFVSQGFGRIGYQPQGRISGKARRKKAVHLEVVVTEAK